MIAELLSWLRFFFRRRPSTDLDDELQFHVEQATQANIAAGMNPDEARRMGSRQRHLHWRSAAVVTLLTWSTVVFEISWPFLIWFRKTRFWMVCGAVLLHAMIAYFMGLVWFSLVMISALAVALDDSEYRRAAGAVRRVLGVGHARPARVEAANDS